MTNETTRREFLVTVASATGATVPLAFLLGGCAATGLVSYRHVVRNRQVSLTVSDYPELKEIGGAIEMNLESFPDPVVVVHASDTEFVALSPVCTHLGCTVRKEASFFRCPCHGSAYDLNGTVVRGPSEKPLTLYQTEIVGNQLIIHF